MSAATFGQRLRTYVVFSIAAFANAVPYQLAQGYDINMAQGMCFLFYYFYLYFRFRLRFGFFSGFDSAFGVFRNSVSNSVKAWYRARVDSKPLMILAYRLRNPGVSHSKCQSFMDTWTFLGFCRRKNFFLGALPISRFI